MDSTTHTTRIVSSDFDGFASQLAMAVWNRMTQFPQFQKLEPKDYPALFEAVETTLKPFCIPPAK